MASMCRNDWYLAKIYVLFNWISVRMLDVTLIISEGCQVLKDTLQKAYYI